MAELTAEVVRQIVKEEVSSEISGLRTEMKQGFEDAQVETNRKFDRLRREMNHRFHEARNETASAIDNVLETVRNLTDVDLDQLSGVKGRLSSHNERIARLERLNHLRE